jgi:hypothetical protein
MVVPELSEAAEWIKAISIQGLPTEQIESMRHTLSTVRANLLRELD